MLTQPLWVVMLLTPFVFIALEASGGLEQWTAFRGCAGARRLRRARLRSALSGCCPRSVVQIGEQVDYLRFLPDKTRENRLAWWSAVIAAGPGWIIIGGFKILCGSLLAVLAFSAGLSAHHGARADPHVYQGL